MSTIIEEAELYEFTNGKYGFIAGAKWQQEKSYSEKEVLNFIFEFSNDFKLKKEIKISVEEQKTWFKQFKKK